MPEQILVIFLLNMQCFINCIHSNNEVGGHRFGYLDSLKYLLQADSFSIIKKKTYDRKHLETGNWIKPIPRSLSKKVPIKENIFWNLELGEPIHNLNGAKQNKN